jgi:hypothetical protein
MYQELPDPRPIGVRFTLGPLPRWAALFVALVLVLAALGCFAGAWADPEPERLVYWLAGGLAATLVAGQCLIAIRWSDRHRTWPRRKRR